MVAENFTGGKEGNQIYGVQRRRIVEAIDWNRNSQGTCGLTLNSELRMGGMRRILALLFL